MRFLALFALLMGAFETSRGTPLERLVTEGLILAPTVALVNAVTPNEHVAMVDRALTSPHVSLHITRGCEGIEMFLLLVAAMLAFPATLRHRAAGLASGLLLAWLLSVSRLTTLYYVLRDSPSWWDALHGLILPLAPIGLLSLYFLRWTTPRHAT